MEGPETIVGLLIASASLAAAVRLLLWRQSWRSALLALLSLASGTLLYLTLFPPHLPVGGDTLLVATAQTPAGATTGPGQRLVALPEAPRIAGAERVPDLATALRRHTRVQRLRILGRGLTARDRDGAAGMPVEFEPAAVPRGLVRLDPPPDTPAGGVFALAGEAAGLEGGSAELLDPTGRRVDLRTLGRDGAFTLGGTARAPGLALFTLRLRGRDKAVVSDTPVPLRTLAARPLRAILIGAPSPEAKFLRRWAMDSGIALQSRLDAGGGVDLGGDAVRLDPSSLRDVDVAIIDDQALAAMGSGARGALARAVAGGLGLVVRMTAPARPGTRENWRVLGLDVDGGGEIAPVALSPLAVDEEALTARRGPDPSEAPENLNTLEDPAPELGRWRLRSGPEMVAAVNDADGAMLVGWQQRGQGRVAIWSIANGFALVLNGNADRYHQWWSDTLSAVSRPESVFRPDVSALPRAGQRMTVCGLTGAARVRSAGGAEVALAIDPQAGPQGCAAYWPDASGIHTIIQSNRNGESRFDFLAFSPSALAAIEARELGEATQRWAAEQTTPAVRGVPERRGAAWPYLLGWLVLAGALWLGERRWLMPRGDADRSA